MDWTREFNIVQVHVHCEPASNGCLSINPVNKFVRGYQRTVSQSLSVRSCVSESTFYNKKKENSSCLEYKIIRVRTWTFSPYADVVS